MSETILWKCDRCQKEWNSNEDKNPLRGVSVAIHRQDSGARGCPEDKWKAQWCKECLTATGLWRTYEEASNPDLPEPLSLEEMIREICREEIDAQ